MNTCRLSVNLDAFYASRYFLRDRLLSIIFFGIFKLLFFWIAASDFDKKCVKLEKEYVFSASAP